jgi:Flp pilus assembly secretin CpaC
LFGLDRTRRGAPATIAARLPRAAALVAAVVLALPGAARAQQSEPVTRLDLSASRSVPLQAPVAVTRVTIANPDVADVVVIGERDVVLNAKAPGETDVLMFGAGYRKHYRVSVHTPPDRPQVVLAVKIAEVRRDRLAQFGVSALSNRNNVRGGTGIFNTDLPFTGGTAGGTNNTNFATVLTDFGTRDLLAFIQAEETRGTARVLAQPTLMAANRDSAVFLAGGEIPIPIAQPTQGGQTLVTIVFREFGVRLNFSPEILSDSIVKLRMRPEVSSLDYSNALILSGFRIPALRTRRVETTVDVQRDRSLIISGLLNDERQRTRTGVPLLMDIPILGALFSSTQWQRNETELLVIVTPTVIDPLRPRPQDTLRLLPDTTLPARDAIAPRLQSSPPARRP